MRLRHLAPLAGALALSSPWAPTARADGFVETVIADSLNNPVSMAIAPDGRIFVCLQPGDLRVIENGNLLPQPFLTVTTDPMDEEGLLGVALDPDFPDSNWVYIVYTALTPARHQRVARYRASGNVAVPGSGVTLLDFDNSNPAVHYHAGGGLHFGPDGKLYTTIGDNGNGSNAQSISSLFGKILRINRDGTIPIDNPFYGSTTGKYRAIWAMGLRNPFSFAFQPGTGRLFLNDVGAGTYEEVDEIVAGRNYGWPIVEGPGGSPTYIDPIHFYDHSGPQCAIVGGTFFDPVTTTFPVSYRGKYFYSEYCVSVIRYIDPFAPSSYTVFRPTLTPGPVDLRVGPDGNLYYLARGNTSADGGDGSITGIVVRVSYLVTSGVGHPAADVGLELRNAPNPFREQTVFSFTLPHSGAATLWIHDVRGQVVAKISRQGLGAGAHTMTWEERDIPPGLYFATLQAAGRVEVRKIARVR